MPNSGLGTCGRCRLRRFLACLAVFACVFFFFTFTANNVHPGWALRQLEMSLAAKSNVSLRSKNATEEVALAIEKRSAWRSPKLMDAGGHVERIGDGCTMEDIAIFQGETGPMPDGIPSFTVQIFNLCVAGCPVADIHVSCGWFASAILVNPKLFKRLGFDDCIVKNGEPLSAGESLTFQYANSFQYPFSIAYAVYACPH